MTSNRIRVEEIVGPEMAGMLLAAYVDSVGSGYYDEDPDEVAAWIAKMPTTVTAAKRACAAQLRLYGTHGQRDDLSPLVAEEGRRRWREWFPADYDDPA